MSNARALSESERRRGIEKISEAGRAFGRRDRLHHMTPFAIRCRQVNFSSDGEQVVPQQRDHRTEWIILIRSDNNSNLLAVRPHE